jgi:putative SOS response-associated peptidase YedK
MCGRYYRTFDKQKIAEALRAQATGDPLAYAPGYNIAPTTTQPVLRQERETFGREIVPMRWGLVGFGSKGLIRNEAPSMHGPRAWRTAPFGNARFIGNAALFP